MGVHSTDEVYTVLTRCTQYCSVLGLINGSGGKCDSVTNVYTKIFEKLRCEVGPIYILILLGIIMLWDLKNLKPATLDSTSTKVSKPNVESLL